RRRARRRRRGRGVSMEIYLKRFFWTLPVFMIIVCAILAALGVNHVVEAKYLLGSDNNNTARPAHHAKPVKHDAAKPPPSKDAQDVLSRNMFCSTCDPPKPADQAPAPPVDENHPPPTGLPLALLATIVASDPSVSGATIFNTSTFKSGSYGVGDMIPDAGLVKRIHPKSVDFVNKTTNRLERVDLLPTGAPPPVPVAKAAPPPPAAEPANPDS